jgi:hypothetical protein
MSTARSGRSRFIDPTPTITPPLRATASILAFCSLSRLIATAPPSLTISTQVASSASERSRGTQALTLYSCVFLGAVCVCLGLIDGVATSVVRRLAATNRPFFHIRHRRGERHSGQLRVDPRRHTFRTRAYWKHTETGSRARCSTVGMSVAWPAGALP